MHFTFYNMSRKIIIESSVLLAICGKISETYGKNERTVYPSGVVIKSLNCLHEKPIFYV